MGPDNKFAKYGVHCWVLHVASVFTPCCMLLRVVGIELLSKSLKPVKLLEAFECANGRNNS